LVDANGVPLLKTVGLTPDFSLPQRDAPDVVVATPARAAEDLCRFSEGAWRRGTFSKNVTFIRHVVFDEADQLLSGGYLRPVRGIFDVLYREEKLAALGLTVDAEEDDESGNEKEPGWSGDAARGVDGDARDWRLDHRDVNHEKLVKQKAQISGKGKGPALGGKGGVGVGAGRAFRRQYAFAAATVMSNGKKTPGAMIKYGFPDAVWVEGRRLHRAVPNVTQTWINVSDTSRADALGAALGLGSEGFRPDVDCAKTMVFVNSAEACEAVAAELKRQGFKAEAFGAQCTNSERAERLRAFADGSVSVLACTDAAARGVDVPGVAHVVQAEFAGNAVEYLHRIGRTARLGAKGLVTNLVGEKDEELVRAVRDCENRGVAVEGAFSRKRSFRKKFKKYGETRTAPQNRR
jgi:superfamily II DNA/RNA helicase